MKGTHIKLAGIIMGVAVLAMPLFAFASISYTSNLQYLSSNTIRVNNTADCEIDHASACYAFWHGMHSGDKFTISGLGTASDATYTLAAYEPQVAGRDRVVITGTFPDTTAGIHSATFTGFPNLFGIPVIGGYVGLVIGEIAAFLDGVLTVIVALFISLLALGWGVRMIRGYIVIGKF